MTNELVKQDTKNVIYSRATDYLNLLGFKFTEAEGKKFIEICEAYQLNPFKHEIYGIQGWDAEKGNNVLTIIVGYEVYLKRAERTGKLDGYEKESNFDKDGNLVSATVIIYRKDRSHPFKHTIYLKEFIRKKKDGTPIRAWATMPIFMLEKVCLAQAFRIDFPDEMGGLPYIKEEIGFENEVNIISAKPVVEMPKEKIDVDKILEREAGTLALKSAFPEAEEMQTVPEGSDYEKLAETLSGCLNLDELKKEWKAHKKEINTLSKEKLSKLMEFKEFLKNTLTGVLTTEEGGE